MLIVLLLPINSSLFTSLILSWVGSNFMREVFTHLISTVIEASGYVNYVESITSSSFLQVAVEEPLEKIAQKAGKLSLHHSGLCNLGLVEQLSRSRKDSEVTPNRKVDCRPQRLQQGVPYQRRSASGTRKRSYSS